MSYHIIPQFSLHITTTSMTIPPIISRIAVLYDGNHDCDNECDYDMAMTWYGHHDMILLVVPHCDIDFHLNLMDGHNASTGQGMNFIMYMIMAMVTVMIMVIFITMPIMWPIWYDMLCDDAVWYSAMRWDGTLCHITIVSFHDHSLSCHTISFHSVSLRVTSHRITTRCATSHHSTPYHVTSHQVTHDPNVMRDAMLVQHNMVLHVVMS